jgi:signal peptide peptidase SppA
VKLKESDFTRYTYAPQGILCVQREALGLEFILFAEDRRTKIDDGVAIVSIATPTMHHANPILDSYDSIYTRVSEAIDNEEVGAIALRIHSPGGDASGVTECYRKLVELGESTTKPIFAFVDELAASAAYYIACAAKEIWLPPAGEVGSIGAIAELEDRTLFNEKAGILKEYIKTGARKDDSRPDRPLTNEVRASVQKRIDHVGDLFMGDVAKARKLSVETVDGFESAVFSGQDAVDVGLADGVSSWKKFLALVKKSRASVTLSEEEPASPSLNPESEPMDLLALVKARETAMAAVLAAKTEEARKTAMVSYEASVTALAQASAATPARPLTALAALEAASAKKDDDDGDDDDDDDDDDEDDKKAKAEEERKAKAEDERKAKKADLRAKMKKCTTEEGKAKYRAKMKKMDEDEKKAQASLSQSQEIELLRAQVEAQAEATKALTASSRSKEVHSMLLAASRDGKLTPAMIPDFREMGLENPERLSKILANLPKLTGELLPLESPDGVSTRLATEAGVVDLRAPQNDDQRKILASMSVGMSKAEKDQLEAAMKIAGDNAKNRAANGGFVRN